MREHAELDEVWFIVSPQNPLKKTGLLLDQQHRLKMVSLAVKGNYHFSASNIEFNLPLPSYTINTINALRNRYPKKKFAIILGSDNLEHISKWKDYETILTTFPVLIYRRDTINESVWKKYSQVRFFDTPLLKISSTYIRGLIAEKKSARYLMPDVVFKYIMSHRLYTGIRSNLK